MTSALAESMATTRFPWAKLWTLVALVLSWCITGGYIFFGGWYLRTLELQAEKDVASLTARKLRRAADRTEAERKAYIKLKEEAKQRMKDENGEERRQLKIIAEEDRQIKIWGTWAMPCNAVELVPALDHAMVMPYSSATASDQDRKEQRA